MILNVALDLLRCGTQVAEQMTEQKPTERQWPEGDSTGIIRCDKCGKSTILKYGLCPDCRRDAERAYAERREDNGSKN